MKLGLALGGGGLRGAAHIGILKVFREKGVLPDAVAGTSAGSIVAALYAAEISTAAIQAFFMDHGSETHSTGANVMPLSLSLPLGLIPGRIIEAGLHQLLGDRTFDQLAIPTAVVATDLYTGEMVVYTDPSLFKTVSFPGVVFANAPVYEAVRASIAIPGIFTPKRIGTRTLVDGGLVDNVPSDVLRILGCDRVIGVDLGFGVYQSTPFHNILDVVLQSYDIMGQRITSVISAQNADLVINPRTPSARLWDFHKVPGMIARGEVAARANWPRVESILK